VTSTSAPPAGRLAGKVAFITGAARGQGRAHAVRLAQEGADVVGIDICGPIGSCEYELGTVVDLDHTRALVQRAGGRFVARQADVRDRDALGEAVDAAIAAFGSIDIVVANAGIGALFGESSRSMQAWHDSVDVLLTGAYNTVDLIAGHMVDQGRGGSVVLTSSTQGLRCIPSPADVVNRGFAAYTAAKHGVVGLMRYYATALGPHGIRVNSIHPGGVNTPIVQHDGMEGLVRDIPAYATSRNALPVGILEPEDIAAAVAWLCSDEARYVTGVALPGAAGHMVM